MSPPDPSLLVLVIQVALVASVSAAMNSNRVVVIDTHNHIHVRVSLEPFLHLNTFWIHSSFNCDAGLTTCVHSTIGADQRVGGAVPFFTELHIAPQNISLFCPLYRMERIELWSNHSFTSHVFIHVRVRVCSDYDAVLGRVSLLQVFHLFDLLDTITGLMQQARLYLPLYWRICKYLHSFFTRGIVYWPFSYCEYSKWLSFHDNAILRGWCVFELYLG